MALRNFGAAARIASVLAQRLAERELGDGLPGGTRDAAGGRNRALAALREPWRLTNVPSHLGVVRDRQRDRCAASASGPSWLRW